MPAVTALICKKDIEAGTDCLLSLKAASPEPVQLLLFEDGSLNADERDMLLERLDAERVIPGAEADERISEALGKHPGLLKWRNTFPMARKLLDCVLLDDAETFYYCDTDILFLRPCSNLWLKPCDEVKAVFLQDIREGYSLSSKSFWRFAEWRVPSRVNAGFVNFHKSLYDLDRLEYLIALPELHARPFLVEQTMWAFMVPCELVRLISPEDIVYATDSMIISEEMAAVHFVSPSRWRLQDHRPFTGFHPSARPKELSTFRPKQCTPLRYMMANRLYLLKTQLQRI